MGFQTRLEAMKKARGYTTQQISDLSKVPLQTVRRIFEGSTQDPGISTMHAIVDALDYKLDDLYSDCDLTPEVYDKGVAPAEPVAHYHHFYFEPYKGDIRNTTRDAIAQVYAGDAYKIVHNNLIWWRVIAIFLILLVAGWFIWDVTQPDVGMIQYETAAAGIQYGANEGSSYPKWC